VCEAAANGQSYAIVVLYIIYSTHRQVWGWHILSVFNYDPDNYLSLSIGYETAVSYKVVFNAQHSLSR